MIITSGDFVNSVPLQFRFEVVKLEMLFQAAADRVRLEGDIRHDGVCLFVDGSFIACVLINGIRFIFIFSF